jgi:hypothetical protein
VISLLRINSWTPDGDTFRISPKSEASTEKPSSFRCSCIAFLWTAPSALSSMKVVQMFAISAALA